MFEQGVADAFLLRHHLHPDCYEMDAEIATFRRHMEAGLQHDVKGSLLMLPTYIDAEGDIPDGQSAIVIDAGGTNLRIGLVRFTADGAITEYFEKHPMPGSDRPIIKDAMFDAIAAHIEPLTARCDRIGFCFSYVFESMPDRDGIVAAMCKEVEIIGIEGARACAELEAALRRRGVTGERRYVMLNDTVATLLGAEVVHSCDGYDSFVGMILGTGLNACYIEKTENIEKCKDGYFAPRMIVNMESGIYSGFKQGTADQIIDANSQIPGDHKFEKMVSGGYFGDLLYVTLRLACDEGLFSANFCEGIAGLTTVSLREITDYIEGRAESGNIYQAMADLCERDRESLDCILDRLYERAAKLVLVQLCAIAEQIDAGRNAACPLCVCAEGTTYYRSPLLLQHIDRWMEQYVVAVRKRHIRIVKTNSATLIGTALAALIN